MSRPRTLAQLRRKKRPPQRHRDHGPYANLYSHRAWRKLRLEHLYYEPACRICAERGYDEPAAIVDHIVPHRGDPKLMWDTDNLQSLCKRCHDIKTWSEVLAGSRNHPKGEGGVEGVGRGDGTEYTADDVDELGDDAFEVGNGGRGRSGGGG